MSWVAVGVAGAGLLGSLAGGAMSASAASGASRAQLQAAKDAQDFRQKETGIGQLMKYVNAYGADEGLKRFKAFLEPSQRDLYFGRAASNNFSDVDRTQLENVTKQIDELRNTPAYKVGQGTARDQINKRIEELVAQKAALVKKAGGDPGQKAILDEESIKALGPGLVTEYNSLADAADTQRLGNLNQYDAATQGLDQQSRDLIRYAQNFGKQRESTIRSDADRSLKAANRQSTAALMGRGLGASTALTDAYGGNAEGNQRALDSSLGSLYDQQIQMGTGLRTGRLGLLSSRASGRDAMNLAGQDTSRGLRLGALNYKQSVIGGADMNPWLGENVSQYFPSTSPSAAALGTAGSALSGTGSALAGYGFQSYLSNLNRPSTAQQSMIAANNPYQQGFVGPSTLGSLSSNYTGE